MKILVVSTVQTNPTTSGSAKFIKEYCDLLGEMGHEVFFLLVRYYAFTEKNKKTIHIGNIETKNYWKDHYFYYEASLFQKSLEYMKYMKRKIFNNYYCDCDDHYPIGLQHFVNRLDSRFHFDACIINYFWLSKLFNYISIPRCGIITHDSFTYNNIRNNVKSILNLYPNEESKALQRCPTIFAMQGEEAVYFRRLAPKSKVLTSYCSYHYEQQKIVGNHNLLFLSSAFYLNVNGLKWFINNIFPIILKKFPDSRIKLGGSICNVIKDSISHSNIDLLGYIENPSDFYALGDVAINPTYQGTGLKIKTFESIAYDKVTMVHPHSMGGIYKENLSPLFASECANEWVDYLSKVWTSTDYIIDIKKRNRSYIESMNLFIKSQFIEFLS